MGRLLCNSFVPRLISNGFYGASQYAYTPGKGARDAVLWLVLYCLRAFSRGQKTGLYRSDVSGAFDRVKAEILLRKLAAAPIPQPIFEVIRSWLAPRTARVAVNGCLSDVFQMLDMVFQGTVWGTILWNVFFADASQAVTETGFDDIVFADDLNAVKTFAASAGDPSIHTSLRDCQFTLHRWGRANSVVFDASKESTHILALRPGDSSEFKILGVVFDCQLRMAKAIDQCAAACHSRVMCLLHARRYHSLHEMVLLYKSHVVSFAEYRTPAIAHASRTALEILDNVQRRFLRAVGITEVDALVTFKLAPLSTRRDIATLGVIHRSVLGLGPASFRSFFCLDPSPPPPRSRLRHHRRLHDPCDFRAQDFLLRSALGGVRLYNILPDFIVAANTVREFQSRLQAFVVFRAQQGCADWDASLSWRIPLASHPLRPFRDWHG